ncbi:MAG: hypothetical protein ACHRHE_05645 [Tepidisphaerales bacterium]
MLNHKCLRFAAVCLMALPLWMSGQTNAGAPGDAAPATAGPASGVVTIGNDQVQLSVDPARGRITGYGFKGGGNVFWENPKAVEFAPKFGGWINWGGDKVWVWPQDDWNWPPPIPDLPHEVKKDGNVIEMISPVVPRYGIRVVRRIELSERGTEVTVKSRFIVAGKMPDGVPIGVWSVTQVPATPYVLARATGSGGEIRLNHIGDANIGHEKLADNLVWLKRPGTKSGKVALDAELMAAAYGDYMIVQRQYLQSPQVGVLQVATRGQLYAHPDNADNLPAGWPTYMELEWITPSVPRVEVEKVELKVVYKLVKLKPGTTLRELGDLVAKLE